MGRWDFLKSVPPYSLEVPLSKKQPGTLIAGVHVMELGLAPFRPGLLTGDLVGMKAR